MSPILRVYLSGSIKKGDHDHRSSDHFWTPADEEFLRSGTVGDRLELLNPAKTNIHRSDFETNFACDLALVRRSDIVLVDARTEKGIGVGAEMMFAAYERKPVIAWVPQNGHYRKDYLPNVFGEDLRDWTHPFIHGLSDYVVETLTEAVALLNRQITEGSLVTRKDPERLLAAFEAAHRMGPEAWS